MPIRNIRQHGDGKPYLLFDALEWPITWKPGLTDADAPGRVWVVPVPTGLYEPPRLMLYRVAYENAPDQSDRYFLGTADRAAPVTLPGTPEDYEFDPTIVLGIPEDYDPNLVLGPNDSLERTVEVDLTTGARTESPWRVVQATAEQPPPTGDSEVCVQDEVIADLRKRAAAGIVAGDYLDGELQTTASTLGEHIPLLEVAADIEERKRVGIERYGTTLRPFNGRNALLDAYQECLDMAVYLKQALLEQESQ